MQAAQHAASRVMLYQVSYSYPLIFGPLTRFRLTSQEGIKDKHKFKIRVSMPLLSLLMLIHATIAWLIVLVSMCMPVIKFNIHVYFNFDFDLDYFNIKSIYQLFIK